MNEGSGSGKMRTRKFAHGKMRTEGCEECCARSDTHGNLYPKKLAHGKKRTKALSMEY